jgi:hypothetical protein
MNQRSTRGDNKKLRRGYNDEFVGKIEKALVSFVLRATFLYFQTKKSTKFSIHFLTLLKRSWGAEILTLPGMFLARTSSFTDFSKSFSLMEHVLSLRNIATAVLAALPRFPVPGVNLTLNLWNLEEN